MIQSEAAEVLSSAELSNFVWIQFGLWSVRVSPIDRRASAANPESQPTNSVKICHEDRKKTGSLVESCAHFKFDPWNDCNCWTVPDLVERRLTASLDLRNLTLLKFCANKSFSLENSVTVCTVIHKFLWEKFTADVYSWRPGTESEVSEPWTLIFHVNLWCNSVSFVGSRSYQCPRVGLMEAYWDEAEKVKIFHRFCFFYVIVINCFSVFMIMLQIARIDKKIWMFLILKPP